MQSSTATIAKLPARREGMGAVPHGNGVFFRVWAPHAKKVFVTGDFNDWSETGAELIHEGDGYWGVDVPEAAPNNEYKYIIHTEKGKLYRNDPYAKEVTNSNGNSLVIDPQFDWTDQDFEMPAWNELVIYEMHVGTFNAKEDGEPGTFLP